MTAAAVIAAAVVGHTIGAIPPAAAVARPPVWISAGSASEADVLAFRRSHGGGSP